VFVASTVSLQSQLISFSTFLIPLHDEELHNLCSSADIIRMIRTKRMGWAGLVARVGKMENAFKILVGSPERKIPRESPRRM
jgi:hypothetical protein